MSRVIVSVLTVIGLACLLMFFSYSQQENSGTATTLIGQPSPWYTRTVGPTGTVWHVNLWSLSTLAGAAGIVCLTVAWKGSRTKMVAGTRG